MQENPISKNEELDSNVKRAQERLLSYQRGQVAPNFGGEIDLERQMAESKKQMTESKKQIAEIKAELKKQRERAELEYLQAMQALRAGIEMPDAEKKLGIEIDLEKRINLRLRMQEEPLEAGSVARLFTSITRLYTKCWLIEQGQYEDLIEYTQTYEERFEKEAGLQVGKLSHNSPFEGEFKASPQSVAEGLEIAIDGVLKAPIRIKKGMLENKLVELEAERKEVEIEDFKSEKAQDRYIAAQKAYQDIALAYEKAQREKELADFELEKAKWKAEQEKERAEWELKKAKDQWELDRKEKLIALDAQIVGLLKELVELDAKMPDYIRIVAMRVVERLQPGENSPIKGILAKTLEPEIKALTEGNWIEVEKNPEQDKTEGEEKPQSSD